ncbi:hypothetical protein [uncultured Tateyamaria sp.]|uniref:hypothetical protein n=1 Tax=Tateyamaria sp. 1078 TaxID=3417464 RepID=UPI002626A0A1|nr:hypothetical protein [uncultured Tateyamaria sp.]
MKDLFDEFCTKASPFWCDRVAYAGLVALYGAECLGLVDKDVVVQGATAHCIALTTQQQ